MESNSQPARVFSGNGSPGNRCLVRHWLTVFSLVILASPLVAQNDEAVKAPKGLPGYRIRYPLRVVGDDAIFKRPSQSIIARLPTGGWLRPDGGDVAVQSMSGEPLPTTVLSHHPTGDTLIQFKRNQNDRFYWAYAVSSNAPPAAASVAQEGLSVEFRQWPGDLIDSWTSVVGGLTKSETVLGNAFVGQVLQNCNPARPNNPRNFAASYRGYLNIKQAGTNSFIVNADDAAFLFIDGYKVFERAGSNLPITGSIPLSYAKEMFLTAGVHPFEVHHVCGNNPSARGSCTLLWRPPGAKHSEFIPPGAFAQPLLAEVTDVEDGAGTGVAFTWGVDDTLSSEGVTLRLARFEAQGRIRDPNQLHWDFGDGCKATGQTVNHIYFKEGSYQVTLKSAPDLPAFTRVVYMWTAPHPMSPHSLSSATKIISKTDWNGWDMQRINTMFDFLLISEQPDRWPMVEKLGRHLLAQPDADPKRRVLFYTSLMQALAEQGRGNESIKLLEQSRLEFSKLPTLQVEITAKAAEIYWAYMKDFKEASRLYEKLISENRGLGIPAIREAAIRWGDLFTEAGDLTRASERYKLARTLGGDKFQASANTDPLQQGVLLRVAEQKLRTGDVRQSRQLLKDIELKFPEQKLEGLYRFLRAEADRYAGRYEEAIRNYEVLIKLDQWSSFRDRAFFGLADCYYRMETFEKCLPWLDAIKTSYPKFYEKQKLPEYRRIINERLARIQSAKEEADKKNGNGQAETADIAFRGFITGFEPDSKLQPGQPEGFRFIPMLGIMGPHVGLIQGMTSVINFGYQKRLRNMMATGNYWVEFWYREQMEYVMVPGANPPTFTLALMGSDGTCNPDGGSASVPIERTFGQWRKVGARMKSPVSQDGALRISINSFYGMMQFDGLAILPVSDRQNDSLRSFIEGSQTQ